jgi:hypothetical protein
MLLIFLTQKKQYIWRPTAKLCSGMLSTLSCCQEKVKSLEKACLYMTIPAVMPS